MVRKIEAWFDANSCILGSFEGYETEAGEEADLVYPLYNPANQILGKQVKYPQPVKKINITDATPIKSGLKGVLDRVVFHYNPDLPSPLIIALNRAVALALKNSEASNKALRVQVAQLTKELTAIKSGGSSVVADARSVLGKSRGSESDSPGIPGFPSNFRRHEV